jgi:2-polyprenyl-3-methyl-5-hydroxy-6-metoxy-1,4-benzoquinol methylase
VATPGANPQLTDAAPCLVCEASEGSEPAFGILARCRRCGFITWPGSSTADLTRVYDRSYFTEVDYPDYEGNEAALRRSMRRHLRQMARYGTVGGRLLELGCAYGFFLDEAAQVFDRVVGIDVIAPAVTRARERFGVDARAGHFLEMDLGAERFDAVCLWDTVEHLPRPDEFVAKIHGLIASEGRLYLTTGDISSLNARLRGANWRQIHPPSHLHYFSRETVCRLLERCGFEVLGFETASYYHTAHNVLASMALRKNATARVARVLLRIIGEATTRRVGLWVNLGDIMFVAAGVRA